MKKPQRKKISQRERRRIEEKRIQRERSKEFYSEIEEEDKLTLRTLQGLYGFSEQESS